MLALNSGFNYVRDGWLVVRRSWGHFVEQNRPTILPRVYFRSVFHVSFSVVDTKTGQAFRGGFSGAHDFEALA